MVLLCLKAATNLKHLSLCLDATAHLAKMYHIYVYGLIESYTWTTLTSFKISGIRFAIYPMVSFLKRCTGIRCLMLRECLVKPADISELREKSLCQLTSITITHESAYSCPESNLLDFVNRRSSVLLDSDGDPINSSRNCGISTELPNDDDSTPTSSEPSSLDKKEVDPLDHPWYGWEKPYWSWGRFGSDNDIYCWQVDDVDEAQAGTTIWSYQDSDEWTEYGDPLDYHSDIDGENDLEVTPLPWGREFLRRSASPPLFPDTEPPLGAILYNEEDYAPTACHEVIFG
ncbi:hypothetical protein F4679DRAFT_453068 [Xylaria curta]|nr:hypothetical protein F4679DRAFT_453068 [Xylaria curta]